MPLFSIIVPIYNVEEYLDKCVCSILNQTFSDFELILVDDGSPDNCPKLCDEYEKKDSRIKVVHKENGGLSSARNAGLDIATGKYVYFVDSDDYIKQNLFETVVPYLEKGADFVVFQYEMFNGKKMSTYDMHDTGCFSLLNDVDRRDFITNKILTGKIGWSAWSRVFVRELIEKYHIRFEDNKKIFAEDLYFSLCYCAHIENIVSISDRLYVYLLREDSIMGRDQVKLNIGRYNELSKAVFSFYKKWNDCRLLLQIFPIIHNLICSINLSTDIPITYKDFSEWRHNILDNISDKRFFFSQVKKIKKHRKNLRNILGGREAELSISYMTYIKNGNYLSLRIRNHLIYKNSDYINMHTENIVNLELKYKNIDKFKKRVFLLGTEEQGNLGDHQINESIVNFIKEVLPDYFIHEVTVKEWNDNILLLQKYIRKNDIIVFPGGGNFGDVYETEQIIRNKCIKLWSENEKIVFPQTIYFTNTEKGKSLLKECKSLYTKENNITLYLRENTSYEFAKDNFSCECKLVPDIVFYSDYSENSNRKNTVILCIRSDSEKSLSDETAQGLEKMVQSSGCNIEHTDLQLNFYVSKADRRKFIDEKINLWKKSKLVITDRLHGMIFSAITGTPCIVFSNYNHKVKGTYEWIKYLSYIRYAENLEDAKKYFSELYEMENCVYDKEPLKPYFDSLADVIKSCSEK